MTLVIAHPDQRWIAADRRTCYGHMYRDDVLKVHAVAGMVVAGAGTPRTIHQAHKAIWELWGDSAPGVRELDQLVEKLAEVCPRDSDGDVEGHWVVGYAGKVYEIDSGLSLLPVTAPLAIGSGQEAGQALLNYGLGPKTVFEVVAKSNYTVGPTYNIARF